MNLPATPDAPLLPLAQVPAHILRTQAIPAVAVVVQAQDRVLYNNMYNPPEPPQPEPHPQPLPVAVHQLPPFHQ